MSMLAERKRKTKWVINPTKTPLWAQDSSGIKFGKELMEKMGWSAGKGLGLKEQGIEEPLRLSYKNDKKGMGFKGHDDEWIEHQDEFNSLLSQLSNNNDSDVLENSEIKKPKVKSLELKSKHSRARVHYQKFTRGKDLSNYSEQDLACILGVNKSVKEKSKPNVVIGPEVKSEYETSFGVTTINSGSIDEYFKKKYCHNKIKPVETTDNTNENFCETKSIFPVNGENNEKPVEEERKRKKRKHKSEEDTDVYETIESLDKISVDEQLSFTQNGNKSEEWKCKKRKMSKSQVQPPETDEIKDCEVAQFDIFEGKTEKQNKNKIIESNFEETKNKKRKENFNKDDNMNKNKSQECDNIEGSQCSPEDESFPAVLKEKNMKLKNEKKKTKHKKQTSIPETQEIGPISNENLNDNEEFSFNKERKSKHKKHKLMLEAEIIPMSAENLVENEESNSVSKKKSKHEKKKLMLETEKISRISTENLVENEESSFVKQKKSKYKLMLEAEESVPISTENPVEGDKSSSVSEKKAKRKKHKLVQETPEIFPKSTEILVENEESVFVKQKRSKHRKHKLMPETEEIIPISTENLVEIEKSSFLKEKKPKHKKHKLVIEAEEIVPMSPENLIDNEESSLVKQKKSKKKKLKPDPEEETRQFEVVNLDNISCEQSEKINEELENVTEEKQKMDKRNGGVEMENNLILGVVAISKNNSGVTNAKAEKTEIDSKETLKKNSFTSERVLDLIRWADIKEFRGSNLGNVLGYGFKKEYLRNKVG